MQAIFGHQCGPTLYKEKVCDFLFCYIFTHKALDVERLLTSASQPLRGSGDDLYMPAAALALEFLPCLDSRSLVVMAPLLQNFWADLHRYVLRRNDAMSPYNTFEYGPRTPAPEDSITFPWVQRRVCKLEKRNGTLPICSTIIAPLEKDVVRPPKELIEALFESSISGLHRDDQVLHLAMAYGIVVPEEDAHPNPEGSIRVRSGSISSVRPSYAPDHLAPPQRPASPQAPNSRQTTAAAGFTVPQIVVTGAGTSGYSSAIDDGSPTNSNGVGRSDPRPGLKQEPSVESESAASEESSVPLYSASPL
jgi:hypothetical protein